MEINNKVNVDVTEVRRFIEIAPSYLNIALSEEQLKQLATYIIEGLKEKIQ